MAEAAYATPQAEVQSQLCVFVGELELVLIENPNRPSSELEGRSKTLTLGSELRREIPDFVVFMENFGNLGFRYSQYEEKYKNPLELELILSQMAQKPMLRGEVGARALRVRSDVRGHG